MQVRSVDQCDVSEAGQPISIISQCPVDIGNMEDESIEGD